MANDDRAVREQLAARARQRLRASLEQEAAALGAESAAVRADLDAFLARLAVADEDHPSRMLKTREEVRAVTNLKTGKGAVLGR